MSSDPQITWVLGSGFSVPLGGPILVNLISRASKATIQKIFPREKFPKLYDGDNFDASYKIYDLGHSPSDNKIPQMWTDAEQYLDYLDTATTFPAGPAAARLNYVISHAKLSFEVDSLRLANTTRRIIAAEYSVFLENTSTELEKWQPYLRWAAMLNKNHTVISFNYDRVLEILAEIRELQGIDPDGFVGISNYNPDHTEYKNIAEVIKLHGSVDW
jgi:hypothetical protein